MRIILIDEREIDKKDEFIYQGGIIEFVKKLNEGKKSLHENVVYVEGQEDGISMEAAFQYTEDYTSQLYSFTNNISTYIWKI